MIVSVNDTYSIDVFLCSLWGVGLTDDTLELFASFVHECVTLRLDCWHSRFYIAIYA